MCDDGVSRMIDISAGATGRFSCVYQERIRTPKGEAVVLGVHADMLYVLLDTNAEFLVATAFTKKDFDDGLLEVIPTVPPLVALCDSHKIKRNVFRGRSVGIVTQACNGPCPVVALVNALVLMGRLSVYPENSRWVEAKLIRSTIISFITENKPRLPQFVCPATRVVDGEEVATIAGLAQQRLGELREALAKDANGEALLQRLYHGMNISPIFSHIDGFAAEDDILLFSLAGVRVVHGWLISPESKYAALRCMSFNEVSLLATNKENGLCLIASDFLQSTISQMTEEGLNTLRRELGEGEVVVLFWNNHFSTAVKLSGRLLLLLSDETYVDKSCILFEAIEDVHGAATFTDGNGVDADDFLLAVQSLTGDEFAPEAVAAAKAELRGQSGAEPLPEAVVDYLRGAQQSESDVVQGEEPVERKQQSVHDDAVKLMEMGFDLTYARACELVEKSGNLSVAVSQLCSKTFDD